jgi:hypothetical protein
MAGLCAVGTGCVDLGPPPDFDQTDAALGAGGRVSAADASALQAGSGGAGAVDAAAIAADATLSSPDVRPDLGAIRDAADDTAAIPDGGTPAEDGAVADAPAADVAIEIDAAIDTAPPDAAIDTAPPDAAIDTAPPDLAVDTATPDLAVAPVDSAPADASSLTTGLLLYWKFDEASGMVALDSSGNQLNGTYTGVVDMPAPTMTAPLPPTLFPNPSYRAFVMANRQGVSLPVIPPTLKATAAYTVSLWYRATMTDTSGSELFSAGDNLLLRLKTNGAIDFARHITGGTYSTCRLNLTTGLDGKWHHVAGVSTATGAQLYFDGVEHCTLASTTAMLYDRGEQIWVGRHGTGNETFDFDGNIDEVRVYTRALSIAEIKGLAAGGD